MAAFASMTRPELFGDGLKTFTSDLKEYVDATDTPGWAMLPVNGEKKVKLENAAGAVLSLKDAASQAVTFSEEPSADPNVRIIKLKAGNAGKNTLVATKGGAEVASLEINVLAAKSMSIGFCKVIDADESEAPLKYETFVNAVKMSNMLLSLQTNVSVSVTAKSSVKVPYKFGSGLPWDDFGFDAKERELLSQANLGIARERNNPNPVGCVIGKKPGPLQCSVNDPDFDKVTEGDLRKRLVANNKWHFIYQGRIPNVDCTVFVIPGFDVPKVGPLPGILASTAFDCIMFTSSGSVLKDGCVLAHELGHLLLGTTHYGSGPKTYAHSSSSGDLMYKDWGLGWHISQAYALKMNEPKAAATP